MRRQGPEFPAYRLARHPGHGPSLRHQWQPRRLPPAAATVASEVLGIPFKTDPLTADGKPEAGQGLQDATAAFDSAGICIFTSFAPGAWPTSR